MIAALKGPASYYSSLRFTDVVPLAVAIVLGRRGELQRADVAAKGPVAANIDSTIPELVSTRAGSAVARINRRAFGEQRNVLVAWYLVVVHKHAQARIADKISRGKIDDAAPGVPNDVISEGND